MWRAGWRRRWRGLRVLITAGPTREHLDPIRFLTNAATGRMGLALAAEAKRLGARPCVVCGPTAVAVPRGLQLVRVGSAIQMRREVLRRLPGAAAVIGTAAVSDWRFESHRRHKLRRGSGPLRLTLIPNPDIIKEAARRRRGGRPVVAGFALETRGGLSAAREKLERKGLDLIVANGPSSLGSTRIRMDVVTRAGATRFGPLAKTAAAREIFRMLSDLL